jgi:hypothetical protein
MGKYSVNHYLNENTKITLKSYFEIQIPIIIPRFNITFLFDKIFIKPFS